MEAIVISFVALLLLLVVGGAMLHSNARDSRGATLEPPAPPSVDDSLDALKGVPTAVPEVADPDVVETQPEVPEPEVLEKPNFRDRLGKARGLFGEYLGGIRGRSGIDQSTWDDLEEAMIRADVGITTTTALLDELRGQVKAEGIKTPD